MKTLQKRENLNDREFKQAMEDAAEQHPLLVRFMIASWEFQQFYEVCKEYLENRAETKEYDDDVRLIDNHFRPILIYRRMERTRSSFIYAWRDGNAVWFDRSSLLLFYLRSSAFNTVGSAYSQHTINWLTIMCSRSHPESNDVPSPWGCNRIIGMITSVSWVWRVCGVLTFAV